MVIRNQGDTAVSQPFWVDTCINPRSAPSAVNQVLETHERDGGPYNNITRTVSATQVVASTTSQTQAHDKTEMPPRR